MIQRLLKPHRYPEYVRALLWRKLLPVWIRGRRVTIGRGVMLLGMPIVTTVEGSSVTIGDRVSLCSKSSYTALGVNHPIVIRTLRHGAAIVIGHDCGLSGTTICAESSITIGDQCLIGANVIIADTDFHPIDPTGRRYNRESVSIATKPVRIGDNVFVGANSVVLKGVTIGANSVVGAGSVVVKDVPANCIVAGNPAKFIKWL